MKEFLDFLNTLVQFIGVSVTWVIALFLLVWAICGGMITVQINGLHRFVGWLTQWFR